MRIRIGISGGMLEVYDCSQAMLEMLLGTFRPDQGDELSKLFSTLIRGGWDGLASGFSSMNWATENGWPSHDPWDEFVLPAVRRAVIIIRGELAKKEPSFAPPRAESGPIQFGDDWPGVFLRGDYAGPMSFVLNQVLDAVKDGKDVSPMDILQLRGLANTLAASDVRSGTDKKILRPYEGCLPGHTTLDENK
jgi:hypothetical protein